MTVAVRPPRVLCRWAWHLAREEVAEEERTGQQIAKRSTTKGDHAAAPVLPSLVLSLFPNITSWLSVNKIHRECFLAFTHKWNHLFQEDIGQLRAALSLLQSGATSDFLPDTKPQPQTVPPVWCKCACCVPASALHEELCCRRSDGACITSSPLFELLVLRRSTLEAALLYRDPLDPPTGLGQTTTLRHCAYRQYICWRFGEQADGSHPVIPSCCVWRIREEYPSLDRCYGGFRPEQTANIQPQVITNGELLEA